MNGHASSLDVLVTNGTELAAVPKSVKATLGADAPSEPQAQAPASAQARGIAGVYVEASGQAQSLYAAMKQGLLPFGLGLALLEAQAATGGLVDPAQGRPLLVSEALQQGLVGLELKEKLLAAERAVTGYPDPYGGERLALFQAIGKEVVGRALGWSWLEAQLATGGLVDPTRGGRVAPELACQQGLLDQETWRGLTELGPGSSAPGFLDPNTLEELPYRELLGRCVRAPGSGLALLPLKTTFRTLSGAVSLAELLEVGILDPGTARGLREGGLAVQDVSARAEVQRYLQGTGGMAGVVLLPAGHKKSFFQAAAEHLLPAGATLPLLEAQAATCTLVDPATGRQLCVDEAVRAGLVGPELHRQLLAAEQAVMGYPDPFSGTRIPLFQAMKKELVDRPLALRLLDAQLATGGLVCPTRRLRLPLEAALRFGCLDEETQQHLSQAAGFSDPGTQESLSYGQLLARCVTDPETGLAFLPVSAGSLGEEPRGPPFIEHSTRQALRAATATISVGKFQGRPVSLWELLFSEAVPVEQRITLTQQHKDGALSVDEVAAALRATLEQAAASARPTFPGLRVPVTPGELLTAEIIDQDVFEQLERGQATAQDVGSLDSVQRYLQGTGCIAGVLPPGSQEPLGIREACGKGLLRPGTALILLEAQAATGFIIDPKENRRYSVEEALRAGVIGPEMFEKLLSAERAVTGYTDPYTGEQISLFQAMKKDLIVREHGLRLLEAQIATGGVIDPVHSHRVPVDVAYQRGYFDEELSRVLEDPSDDTKGFFDPNTHENLTYMQLLERCVRDPDTGLFLLPLTSSRPQLVDGATRQAFQSLLILVKFGRFRGQKVSAWDLLNSEYFSETARRRLLQRYRLRQVSLEEISELLEREMERWADITLPALRGRVTAYQLLEARIIDQELLARVLAGAVSPEALLRMDQVRRYLRGSGAVGGVLLQPSNRRLSLYQAMKQKLLGPGVALALLEAQAATGAITDACSLEAVSVDEAVRRELVGPELCGRLRQAEDAVTGLQDPFSGKRVSLFQAMRKGLVPVEQAVRLLDAQVATGGVIDPTGHHHLPMPVAIQRGCVDQDMELALSSCEPFPTPDGRGHTSYAQLLEQCVRDEASGLHLLPLSESAPAVPTDEQLQETLQATRGEDGTSVWELLGSCHFTEEQRRAFLEDFRVGKSTAQQLLEALQRGLREAELLARARVALPGPRGEVPAVWLLDAGVITQETLAALVQGVWSPTEVARQPGVQACLWGMGCVAGVLLPSGAKASIAQAVRDGLLPVGLGQRLLEAQVASGSLIDPLTSQRLSVEGAVKAGLVAGALSERLRHVERVVAGYTDPYSGGSLSLWQAVEKGLVPQSEGFPLLQAQLATGGAMDPDHGVHLPQAAACRLGLLDERTSTKLTSTEDDVKFFFDPSARDRVTYEQLKERCVLDADTGLWLLPVPQDVALAVDEHTAVALRAMKVPVGAGRFRGLSVSLWDLLHSEYVGAQRRQELAVLCQSGRATALRQVVREVTSLVEASEAQPSKATFRGLRKQVSASDLFRSQLIDKKTLDELNQGKKSVREVTAMDGVRRFLEGGNFIAGVLVQSTKEKMSISEALRRHILRPGTALVLLEAQAATGFLIDPVENRKLTVQEAFEAGMFGRETYQKLLSAERAVTGYTDPYTGEQISLFQAMKKDLIVREHGIRLLEAQIATGGIIDPVRSHRVPVAVAYQRGYFDEEMSRVLEDPSDDTKGFFDPNTHENLTYMQLLERCVRDPDTGLFLLQVVKKGETYVYIDEATRQALRNRTARMPVGSFADQTVSLWDLLCSQYFTEERKRALVQEYRAQKLSLEALLESITTTVQDTEAKNQVIKVAGIGGEVTAAELFNSGVVDKETLDQVAEAEGGGPGLGSLPHVRAYLEGSGCIAGVTTPTAHEVMGIYDASRKGLLPPEVAAQLLEAQAATGFMLDPCRQQKFSVDEAVAAGLVGEELQERLLSAETAAKGYPDPETGHTISLFQAMKRKLVKRDWALRLLEVQVATGGLVDSEHHHRLPLDVAYRRGYLHPDTYPLIADQKCMNKRFVDPSRREKVTYQELQERSHRQESTGWALLPLLSNQEDDAVIDEATRRALAAEQVEVTVGRFKGQRPTVWDLLNSEYVTEEKKLELVAKYKRDTKHELEKVVKVILQIIEENEKKKQQLWFRGIRTQVTAADLFHAAVISREMLADLEGGRASVDEVQQQEPVRRYLEGTSCIAGVLVPAKDEPGRQEKMSIYQAMWKGVLRPGTALVLLEAQAATGFVIDPVRNQKLSVEEAVAAGVVGGELREKLLSAERAVTGYTDPYTGEQISLFQAMKKDLIVREHGIRLLEAQIATGGVIDPVRSHRVPVDVAYQRGYFDEEMSRVLEDPSDDTKGFFDPNTHENLTYMQLLRRCVRDPDTGLFMLQLAGPGSAVHQLGEELRAALRDARVTLGSGLLRGQSASVWELLFYREAMWKGVLRPGTALVLLEAQAATGFVIDPVRNQKLSVEEAVAAGVVGGELREKLLSAERAVTGYTDPYTGEQISLFQAMKKDLIVREHGIRLLEAQIATGGVIDPVRSHRVPVDVAYQRGYFDEEMSRVLEDPSDDTKGFFDPNTHENLTYMQLLRRCVRDPDTGLFMLQLAGPGSAVHQLGEELRAALRDARVTLGSGLLRGQSASVWELLFYREVSESQRQDLLGRYRAGSLTAQEVGAALASLLARAGAEAEAGAGAGAGAPLPGVPDPGAALRAATMEVRVGRLRGPAVPVWDVLASSYVSGATREQLLAQFGSGALGLPALTRRLTTIVEEAEEARGTQGPPAGHGHGDAGPSPGQGQGQAEAEAARALQEQTLRAATMEVRAGRFRGQPVSVWDVLSSSYLGQARRDELLAQHAAGALALPALVATLTQVIEETEERLSKVSFRGLRRQVSASELHTSGILGPETLRDLAQGTRTLQEVTEMDAVKRYLEGTSCIAGVLVPAKDEPGRQEKMSIYQAMWKGVLRPGTALVLLEAQAATGFVIDPVRNQKLSVEEAVAAGVVGGELREKLLSAERAVTGYTDPYTGEQISLFQAMKKDLIVREHGIRLLEAQIATGGVIDPVRSHRVPVDVAYQRGYFDEEMSRVLEDPSDDTKGFFDPNTHENLTYMQLLRRCVRDPDTGLFMLQLAGPGSAVHQLGEELRAALRDARVTLGSGLLRGQSASVWELLFYREVSESQRQDLLGRYRAGSLTAQEVGAALASLLARAGAEAEAGAGAGAGAPLPGVPDPGAALRAATMEVRVGRLRGPAVPVWDVLASSYVSGATREQLLAQFGSGALGLPALTRRLTTIVEEAEEARGTQGPPAGHGHGDAGPSPGQGQGQAEAEAARALQEQTLRAATMEVRAGRFRGQPVSVWDVLSSSYLGQARRDELLAQHAAGALALPALVATLTQVIEETEERLSKVSFRGLRRQVSASELHTSGILGPETLRDLAQGTRTLQEVTEMDAVKRYLEGTSCIAGVLVPAKDEPGRQEKMSIYQAMWKGVLRPGTALVLLEAQAATGFVIDPVRNQKLSVEEAVAAGVVGGELREKLLSAERAVTGYTDPYTGEQISLFQAMKKDLIVREHGIRLLEAQIATGGVIDPVRSHRVPVDVAYQRGYFDEEMSRGQGQAEAEAARALQEQTLRAATMEVRAGRFRGQPVSVWDVLSSSYLGQARRDELLAQHAAGALALPALVATLTQVIEETEERLSKVSFRGLRRQVSASELHTSGILGPETLRDLAQGTRTLQEVTEMDAVKRYLEGTSCIAGVLVPAKDEPGRQEKMSIYQAMWKGVLRPGTALVLLEAQAATGFVIDPVRNQKLSVEEAVAAGVVGGELREKLLSAERAVTGYTDPYTGEQISLFQAMKKDLIVREHGIRLLEAQIATGGVIDPVRSHRVPVDVAYQRGYFDEEMSRVLEDPSDDTKGFFDPNTHENLTYMQLLQRATRDPDTGLLFLSLSGK
uniref:Epiplakin n=1 Tax=Sus scrofa TaxID=9823 RepID=A0A8W4FFH6_PIG